MAFMIHRTEKHPEAAGERGGVENIADLFGNASATCSKLKEKIKKTKVGHFKNLKQQKACKKEEMTDTTSAVIQDFRVNLEQNLLIEAQQQLVEAEECLFAEDVIRTEQEEDKLQADYEMFILKLRMAISDSFIADNLETLKRALVSIIQEETQDRRWAKVSEEQRPPWRPTKCGKIHDDQIQTVVQDRMKNSHKWESGSEKLSTALKREVCRLGQLAQKDLLWVVRKLRDCYPPEFDICKMYVLLYHQVFSSQLLDFVKTRIEYEDCAYILSWIVDFYPKDVLKHKELEAHTKDLSLPPLLPENPLGRLMDQYLAYKEDKVKMWLSNALEIEVTTWRETTEPELKNGYYFSGFAIDIIPLVDMTINEAKSMLSSETKAGHLFCQFDSFLTRYRACLMEFIKAKQENIHKRLCANLVDIDQFWDYTQSDALSLSEEMRTGCLSTLSELKDICHNFLFKQIHLLLKPYYSNLWTQAWFDRHDSVMVELVKGLHKSIVQYVKLKPSCLEEFLPKLHVEVVVEYVRRMMKRKLKLKEKVQQESAAGFILQDCNTIHSVFNRVGYEEDWLFQILQKLSEILRLQDVQSLQLEIAALSRDYADLSEQHVLAVLNLKSNLSRSDLNRIKLCFNDNRMTLATESSPSFFSKVCVKHKIL